jgi:hypothetical protein
MRRILMKATATQWLWISLLSFLAQQTPAQTYSNPIGTAVGWVPLVNSSQFLGARFAFSTSVTLTSVGGEFQNVSGTFFTALVPLSSMTSLPTGNPGAAIPFNPGEVLAYQTFEANVDSTPEIITTPFSIDLSPGVYGVVFGTGLFGASGYSYAAGGMPAYNRVAGSSSFFWSSEPWRWQDTKYFSDSECNVMITVVPEPSGTVLMALGFAGLLLLYRFRRAHS